MTAALLDGKVVAITAAAGTGIGSATARRCLEEGAFVVVSDHHERRLAAIAAELADEHGGDRVWAMAADVTDDAAVHALISGTAAHFGRLDVLVNNAGLGGTASVLEMTDDQWHHVLDVTLHGTFRCLRAALRQMVAQGGGGVVVNNASVLGWRAQPGQAHYAAAKAGVMALTRCAAMDVAAHGIRVNAVAPSLAMHPFLKKTSSADLLAELQEREAFGRAAEPREVANVIVFLASDLASYLTGEVISVSSQHPLSRRIYSTGRSVSNRPQRKSRRSRDLSQSARRRAVARSAARMTAVATGEPRRRRGRPGYDLESVLRAAVEVFNERGYDGASMEDLSKRLGIAKSAIYHHVSGKEELLRIALDRALDGWSQAAERAQELEAPAIVRLEMLVRGTVAVLETQLPYVTLLLRVRGNSDVERAALARRRSFDLLVASLVAEAERDGDVRADVDPKITARLLSGMINSIVEWYRPGSRPAAPVSLADAVCAIAFDGLRVRR